MVTKLVTWLTKLLSGSIAQGIPQPKARNQGKEVSLTVATTGQPYKFLANLEYATRNETENNNYKKA